MPEKQQTPEGERLEMAGETINGIYYANPFGPEAAEARQVTDENGRVYPSEGALRLTKDLEALRGLPYRPPGHGGDSFTDYI